MRIFSLYLKSYRNTISTAEERSKWCARGVYGTVALYNYNERGVDKSLGIIRELMAENTQ